MKNLFLLPWWIFLLLGCGCFSDALRKDESPGLEREDLRKNTFRMVYDNDIYFGSDNIYTTGWSAELHTAPAESWESVDAFLLPVGGWGRLVPTLTEEGLYTCHSLSLSQRIQTPDDLDRRDLIRDDVPYAGALVLSNAWYAFNDDAFRGFDVNLGVVGPASLAEEVQNLVHDWTGSDDPKGWDHQLENEPVFNLGYMRKRKLWRCGVPGEVSGDLALSGDVVLGNLRSAADFMVEARYGRNVPLGFVHTPDNVGRTLHHDASLGFAGPSRHSCYGSLQAGASVVVHDIFFDGNTWRDSHSVDKEVLVGTVILGFHYRYDSFTLHLQAVITTDVVDDSDVNSPETNNHYGSIAVEFRF